MDINPLFPTDKDTSDDGIRSGEQPPISPVPNESINKPAEPIGANPAANLIRQKLDRLYSEEPNAKAELEEAQVVRPLSKHQQFMHTLSTSGKSLAEIQTDWHNYYVSLPDEEKHQVWQEFYEANARVSQHPHTPQPSSSEQPASKQGTAPAEPEQGKPKVGIMPPPKELPSQAHTRKRAIDRRTTVQIRESVRNKVSAGGKLKAKHHVQSAFFGLGMGLLVIFIYMFGFFNEAFIAPFLQPARASASTPIIIDAGGVAPTSKPEVIIPKINVELPVDYNQTSTDNTVIENALDNAIVHYPITSMVGHKGNAVYFGHSASNIFSPGHYKYAFGLLHLLQPGDTFYLTKDKKVYVYKVVIRKVVPPTDVSVLNPVKGYTATATLITCDPPGFSTNRLIIVGQQISPDPAQDPPAAIGTLSATGSGPSASAPSADLPGNGPTLWERLSSTLSGKTILIAVTAVALVLLAWSLGSAQRSFSKAT